MEWGVIDLYGGAVCATEAWSPTEARLFGTRLSLAAVIDCTMSQLRAPIGAKLNDSFELLVPCALIWAPDVIAVEVLLRWLSPLQGPRARRSGTVMLI